MLEQIIRLERMEDAVSLFGNFDQNVKLLKEEFGVSVIVREESLKLAGEPEATLAARRAVEEMLSLLSRGEILTEQKVRYLISLIKNGEADKLGKLSDDCVFLGHFCCTK